MSPSPVQLVLLGPPPAPLLSALEAAGLAVQPAAPTDAAEAVSRGWAKLVICERVPGWQALISRVESAGGSCVLWGPPPSTEDRKYLLPGTLESVADPGQVIPALARAEARLWTQRNAAEADQDLIERALSAERISRFAHSIASQIELPGVIREAISRTRDLCDADGASLLLVDPDTGELWFDTVVGGASGQIETVRLKAGQGIAGKVAQTAEPIRVTDVRSRPEFFSAVDDQSGFSTGSVIAAPLLLGGDVVGVLEAVRTRSRQAFDELHLRRLVDLSPHVTVAVHNAQITAQLRRSQAEVIETNTALEAKVRERTTQIGRAKQEWEQTFDAIDEPIALQDGFTLKRTNLAYARHAGLPVNELPGKTCYEVLARRSAPCPTCPLLGAQAGKLTGEVSFGTSSFQFSGFWLAGPSVRKGVVVHYRDITLQRSLQAQLRESERMAALGQLASGAAHEINNPLGFVTSNLSTLKACLDDLRASLQDAAGAQTQELLQDSRAIIEESLSGAHRVGEIVRALRELSRLEVGGEGEAVADHSVSRAVRAELGDAAPNVVLSLEATAKTRIPPLQLDQVLSHLLRNARQAVTETQRIFVRTRDEGSTVFIEVEDEGCGIPPENLHRIFEPFFTTRGVGKGVGLGLTAAYGIVRRHGGEIQVRSEVGRGSTFIVELPRA